MAERALEIEDLPGVGPSTADKLREAGYISVESIATASPAELSEISEISGTAEGHQETLVPCSRTGCPDGRGPGDPGHHRDVR